MALNCSPRRSSDAAAPAMRWLMQVGALTVAAALGTASYASDDFPPPIADEAASTAEAAPAAGAAEPATPAAPVSGSGSLRATEAAEPALAAGAAPAAKAAPVVPERDVRIEQKRIGRRVSEVIVTPAGFTYHYTMIHLDGQDPGSVLQPHPELSVPRFFRIDF
jgi:hypothetical protein